MKRLAIIGLALAAMFAVSSVMAAAAMAEPIWLQAGAAMAGEATIDGTLETGTAVHLEGSALSVKVEVECLKLEVSLGKALNTGTEGLDEGKLIFLECINIENCASVPSTIEVLGTESELGTEVLPNAGRLVDIFLSNAANEFAKFACGGLVGTVTVLGVNATSKGFACEWDTSAAAAETSAKLHNLICPVLGTALPWCGAQVSLVTNTLGEEEETGINIDTTLVGSAKGTFCSNADVLLLKAGEEINWSIN